MLLKVMLLTLLILGGFILGSLWGYLIDVTIGFRGWGIVAECGGAAILAFLLVYFSLPLWSRRRYA